MGTRRASLVVAALCGAWYALSSASNVVGKLLLSELPLPLTATLAQLVAGALLSHAVTSLVGRGVPAGPTWRVLLPLAAAKLATMLLSQIAIWRMPVSFAHTVKATTPLWTAWLAWLAWGEGVSRPVLVSLGMIAGGVALAAGTELQGDALGLCCALAAAALLAAQHLYSKRALRSGLPPLQLLRALSALALAALLPLWLLRDLPALALAPPPPAGWPHVLALLAGDALLAWLQAVAALGVLARVSPLAYGVASAAKRAVVVAASLLVLRNPAPPLNLAGMALAALGVVAYNRAKARPAAHAAPPLLPV